MDDNVHGQMAEKLYSLEEAAELMGRTPRTLRRWIDSGKLMKSDKTGPRRDVLIPASEVARHTMGPNRIIDTVPTRRRLDRQTLAAAIGEAIDQRTQEIVTQMTALSEEIRALKRALEQSETKRDQLLIQTIRDTLNNNQEKSPNRPWWKFGRR